MRNTKYVISTLALMCVMAIVSVAAAAMQGFMPQHGLALRPKVLVPKENGHAAQFTLVNTTNETIRDIYFAGFPPSFNGKEEVLDAPLASGESVLVYVWPPINVQTGEYVGEWELRTLSMNGTSKTWGMVDLCSVHTITLKQDGTVGVK